MDSANNSKQQKFKDAGEQAGRVISEFMSFADDLSNRFEKEFTARDQSGNDAGDRTHDEIHPDSHSPDAHSNGKEEFVETGFGSGQQNSQRHNATGKVKSVEDGCNTFSEEWPNDWVESVSMLLKQNNPSEFFNKLNSLYNVTQADSESRSTNSNTASGTAKMDSVVNQRKLKLESVFSDEQLAQLTDSQFEELMDFVQTSYRSGLKLVRKS